MVDGCYNLCHILCREHFRDDVVDQVCVQRIAEVELAYLGTQCRIDIWSCPDYNRLTVVLHLLATVTFERPYRDLFSLVLRISFSVSTAKKIIDEATITPRN